MAYKRKTLGQQGIRTGHHQTFVGYLFLPPDMDRDLYIEDCFRSQTVRMRDEKGGYWREVFISKNILGDLIFPANTNSKGSVLICVKVPRNNIPVCIGVLDLKEIPGIINEENQFRLNRVSKDKDNLVEIDGRAEEAELNINISAKETKKGRFNINVSNTDKTAELNLYVKGLINLLVDKDFTLKALRSFNQQIVNNKDEILAKLKYVVGKGLEIEDEWGSKIIMNEEETAIISKSGKKVSVDDKGGVLIDATGMGNVEIKAGKISIEISEQGVTIDVGDKDLFLNGDFPVLYSKSPAATAIQNFSEIGVSNSVKVGI